MVPRLFLLVLGVLIASSVTTAQGTAARSICEGFNAETISPAAFAIPDTDRIAIVFIPRVDMQIGGFECFFTGIGNPANPLGSIALLLAGVEMRDNVPGGLAPGPNLLATGIYSANSLPATPAGNVWMPALFLNNLQVQAGRVYWIIFSPLLGGPPTGPNPANNGISIGTDAAGGSPLLYSVDSGPGFGPILQAAFMLRVLSSDCNPPGRGPDWGTVGFPCQAGSSAAFLTTAALPALGGTAGLSLEAGTPGATWALFFAAESTATPVNLGDGCFAWLEPTSFFDLLNRGSNPAAVGTLDGLGRADISLQVPAGIEFVETQIAFQAAVAAPNTLGWITTQARIATIGF